MPKQQTDRQCQIDQARKTRFGNRRKAPVRLRSNINYHAKTPLSGERTARPESCWLASRQYPGMPLTNSDLSAHAINQLFGIVADPRLKHRLDILDLVNSFGGIAFDQNQVRLFAQREGSNSILLAKV